MGGITSHEFYSYGRRYLGFSESDPDIALRQAREWRRTGDERAQGGINIYIEGGTYTFHEPVFIRPEDSGTEDSPTVIRSATGEKVVLSGGVRINGWKNRVSFG